MKGEQANDISSELSAVLKCRSIDLCHVWGKKNKQDARSEGQTDAVQPDDGAAWQFTFAGSLWQRAKMREWQEMCIMNL